ncbi:MAG TPA: ABC transporter ATP-binding protein [Candidatus Limnocylindrales bacterium]|nr:ABC transporter ATP-binding protein [Candidatus Limnocylindrales bacterium]
MDDAAGQRAAVEVTGLRKHFGQLVALDGISLRVPRGQVYGLLGPNGAGKTTLIRCLVGLLRRDEGEVWVLDRQMPDNSVLGEVGYMTQAPALYGDITAEENVRFFAAIHGTSEIDWALEFVRLQSRRRSLTSELSGGMRTRLSLACTIVHRPRLLLLDEPTVGVDPQLRAELWDGLRAMAADGATIIVSSHVMDEAERCDRLGLILDGRLLAEGSADDLRDQTGTARLEDAFLALAGSRREPA